MKNRSMKLALIVNRSLQPQVRQSKISPSVAEGEIVKELNHPCVTASAASKMTSPQPTTISNAILFVLIEIIGFILNRILLKYVLNIDLCKVLENVNVELCYPPYPTPAPHIMGFNFIDSRSGLRDQLILKDVHDIVYGEYDLDCDLNIFGEGGFNENFYNNGYNRTTWYVVLSISSLHFLFCVLCFAT